MSIIRREKSRIGVYHVLMQGAVSQTLLYERRALENHQAVAAERSFHQADGEVDGNRTRGYTKLVIDKRQRIARIKRIWRAGDADEHPRLSACGGMDAECEMFAGFKRSVWRLQRGSQ